MGIVLQGCNCIEIGGCLSGWISITIHHCIVTIVQFWLELYCNTTDCIAIQQIVLQECVVGWEEWIVLQGLLSYVAIQNCIAGWMKAGRLYCER